MTPHAMSHHPRDLVLDMIPVPAFPNVRKLYGKVATNGGAQVRLYISWMGLPFSDFSRNQKPDVGLIYLAVAAAFC
jgi:hypothetical protein